MSVLIGLMGLVIDSGYAYSERRQIQNAADSAALNGARDLDAQTQSGNQPGADVQVLRAIKQYIVAYNLTVNTSGNSPATLQSATYINEDGTLTYGAVGSQGSNRIPINAVGVRVTVQEPWTPFLVGVLGINSFTIAATASAASGVIPSANAVFVNCPGGQTFTVTGAEDLRITGNVFANGNVTVNGGLSVSGSFGSSGTITGSVSAGGGVFSGQPAQQFPIPDVAFPVGASSNSLGAYYYPGASVVYPEFDQEAYWHFYLGYNLNTLPGQPSTTPYSTATTQADQYFTLSHARDGTDLLGEDYISLSTVLSQIPDTGNAGYPYSTAYAQQYNTFFRTWVNTVGSNGTLPTYNSWMHWVNVDPASANPSDPTTWYTLTPALRDIGLLSLQVVFVMNKTTFPINTFAGKCPTSKCWPSGIWWMLNWPSGFHCASTNSPCIVLNGSDVAWVSSLGTFYSNNIPSNGNFVGITYMTNAAISYSSSSEEQDLAAWGFPSAAAIHPAEAIVYTGWRTPGTLAVPPTLFYTTYQEPLPGTCTSSNVPLAIQLAGEDLTLTGFIFAPYGLISMAGGLEEMTLNGQMFAAQLKATNVEESQIIFQANAAVKGDPLLIG
jgi:Flp pilus assembly protein TadG